MNFPIDWSFCGFTFVNWILACPLKLQDGELYFRTLGDGSGEVWQQKTGAGPQARWRAVQCDTIGNDSAAHEDIPTLHGVRFLGLVNGKHRCKPDLADQPPALLPQPLRLRTDSEGRAYFKLVAKGPCPLTAALWFVARAR
jgi:hypothetical protein